MTRARITFTCIVSAPVAQQIVAGLEETLRLRPRQVLLGVHLDRDATGGLTGAELTGYQEVDVITARESDAAWVARSSS